MKSFEKPPAVELKTPEALVKRSDFPATVPQPWQNASKSALSPTDSSVAFQAPQTMHLMSKCLDIWSTY